MDPYVIYSDGGPGMQWGWTLYSANNKVIALGWGYNTKTGARKAFNRTREIMGGMVWEK